MKQRTPRTTARLCFRPDFALCVLVIAAPLAGCNTAAGPIPTGPIDEMDVRLVGHDYRFYFQYPGQDLTLDTDDDRYGSRNLHVPEDAVIHLQLDSRDFIYTIEIPEIGLYEVAVPELSFVVDFTAKEAGSCELLGSQMCGYDHPELLGRLIVEPVDQFGQTLLFSGDVIASLNFGPATYSTHISPRYRGDAKAYLQTIDRLLEMEAPDLLLTSHPRQQRQYRSIRFDEERLQRLLKPAKQELEQVLRRHEQAGEDFLDESAKLLEPSLWYLGQSEGIGVYYFEHQGNRFLVNAPGGAGFNTFLAQRWEELEIQDRTPDFVLLTWAEEKAWSGLHSLNSEPRIVAHPELLETLRSHGIKDLATPAELVRLSELEIEPVLLSDTVAYAFSVGSKRVLLTPNVPRNLSLVWKNRLTGKTRSGALQPQTDELRRLLSGDEAMANNYRDDLKKLQKFAPDLWLPAVPMSGQNANLYDDRWQAILDDNARQIP